MYTRKWNNSEEKKAVHTIVHYHSKGKSETHFGRPMQHS